MSSLKNFFYEIATEMGRPTESMDPIIKTFEDNWFDTVESIKDLDNDALAKMKVPLRLIEIITKKLSDSRPQPPVQQKESTKMLIEEEKKPEPVPVKQETMTSEEAFYQGQQLKVLRDLLDELKRNIIDSHKLAGALGILEKVIGNLMKDPSNEQFRTLKTTNEKLQQNLFIHFSIFEILHLIGFQKKDPLLQIEANQINHNFLRKAVSEIEAAKEKAIYMQNFNPYQSSFSTTTDMNVANIVDKGETNFDFGRKLDELKQKRFDAIKPYIEDKDVKYYELDPKVSIQSFARDEMVIEEEEDSKANDLWKKEILRWAKEFEANQQFSSRRRKEFEALLKEPLFTESRIRIKFPNDTIFEARFSPKERVKNIIDLIQKYLADPKWDFYLYKSPPVQRITSANWNKTLEEAEMVPSMVLYFGTEQPLVGVKEFLTIKPQKI